MAKDSQMQPPTDDIIGGQGERAQKGNMVMVMAAIRAGWIIDPVIKQAIVGRASRILANPDAKPRDVARASATLLAIERLTLDAAKEEDRMTRLDAGTATENISVVDLPDNALEAVARSIVNPTPAPAKPCRKPKPKG
jgi:hypothetical protein